MTAIAVRHLSAQRPAGSPVSGLVAIAFRGSGLRSRPERERDRLRERSFSSPLSSHLLFFKPEFGSGSHTRSWSRSRNARHMPSSGNASRMPDQVARTHPSLRFASARSTRFKRHRNCARMRFGAQSYAVRTEGPLKSSRSWLPPNQAARSASGIHLWKMPDCTKACAILFCACSGTQPSPARPQTAVSSRQDSANSASCGRSNMSEVAFPSMAATIVCSTRRCSLRAARSSSAATVRRWNAAAAPGTSGFLSGCNARESWRYA
mmetsp:Transcript_49963/g.139983  ORF Transcript_49963/g.139983 Transcript_49963/m.139983 type:complete len:264 (+) Transcript_49963:331-1122(+)